MSKKKNGKEYEWEDLGRRLMLAIEAYVDTQLNQSGYGNADAHDRAFRRRVIQYLFIKDAETSWVENPITPIPAYEHRRAHIIADTLMEDYGGLFYAGRYNKLIASLKVHA